MRRVYFALMLVYNKGIMSTKRLQVFVDKGVHDALRKYMESKYGPNPRNLSSVIQGLIVKELESEGFWGKGDRWKIEEGG